jgi:hypothetical protein
VNILDRLKLIEEHFKKITVKEFEENLEDLGVEEFITSTITEEIKSYSFKYTSRMNNEYLVDDFIEDCLNNWEELAA